MALSMSKKIVCSFGSLSALGFRGSPTVVARSFQASDLSGCITGDNLPHAECNGFSKAGPSFLGFQRFSTTILTPDSNGGAFPSDVLSQKTGLTPERTIGLECV